MANAKFKSKLKALMTQKIGTDGELLTQQAIADATNLSYATVARWYHNKIERLEPETVAKLTGYFNCELADLVEIEPVK